MAVIRTTSVDLKVNGEGAYAYWAPFWRREIDHGLRCWDRTGPLPDGCKLMSEDVPDGLRRSMDSKMSGQLEMHR